MLKSVLNAEVASPMDGYRSEAAKEEHRIGILKEKERIAEIQGIVRRLNALLDRSYKVEIDEKGKLIVWAEL